jgi:hypothetical protein
LLSSACCAVAIRQTPRERLAWLIGSPIQIPPHAPVSRPDFSTNMVLPVNEESIHGYEVFVIDFALSRLREM